MISEDLLIKLTKCIPNINESSFMEIKCTTGNAIKEQINLLNMAVGCNLPKLAKSLIESGINDKITYLGSKIDEELLYLLIENGNLKEDSSMIYESATIDSSAPEKTVFNINYNDTGYKLINVYKVLKWKADCNKELHKELETLKKQTSIDPITKLANYFSNIETSFKEEDQKYADIDVRDLQKKYADDIKNAITKIATKEFKGQFADNWHAAICKDFTASINLPQEIINIIADNLFDSCLDDIQKKGHDQDILGKSDQVSDVV